MKKQKLSPEEIFLKKLASEEKKSAENQAKLLAREERERLKAEKDAIKAIPKTPKPQPTEEELVKRYTNRTIKNQQYHNRVDSTKYAGLEHHTNTKTLWLDYDYFFSVVFQSRRQKFEFFEKY